MEPTRREIVMPDGTALSYVVFEGAEPAVVILHGLAGSSREFEPTARALSGRRVILVDQRGHGRSTRRPQDVSRDSFVDDAVRVISAEATRPVDLVGQSLGAHTAMLVTSAHAPLVRRLVLLECDAAGGAPEDHAAVAAYFPSWPVPFVDESAATAALGTDPLARALIADLEERADGLHPRFEPDVMLAAVAETAAPRWDEWERITTPTLIVYGEEGMFREDQKREFVARGFDVTRIDLAGASHDAHLDAFDSWISALTSFLGPGRTEG